jgi:hypothetical protein
MNVSRKRQTLLLSLTAALLTWSVAHAQGDPAGFVQVLPSDIKWAANPNVPPGGQTAVLLGDPRKPEPYVVRGKFPANFKVMPHTHPDARTYTVLSGTWYLGFGDKFDAEKVKAFPAGSVHTLPPKVPHFVLTKGEEVIFQVNSVGPATTDYVNPADDPRKK